MSARSGDLLVELLSYGNLHDWACHLRYPSHERASPFLAVAAIVLAATMWSFSLVLPVWETRSDNTGQWSVVQGALPALIGWLGLFAWCPAWFANLLLIPVCLALFTGRRVGFWLSVVAFAIAASASLMPAIYWDNRTGVIVGRRIGFYLWLGSFLVLVLAHALQNNRAGRPSALVRWTVVAIIALAVVGLERAFRVGVSPLEATLKDPNDLTAFTAVLARHSLPGGAARGAIHVDLRRRGRRQRGPLQPPACSHEQCQFYVSHHIAIA